MNVLIGIITTTVAILALLIGYITHIVWWVKLMMDNQLDTIQESTLAILGTLVAPIGAIHGIILWFN